MTTNIYLAVAYIDYKVFYKMRWQVSSEKMKGSNNNAVAYVNAFLGISTEVYVSYQWHMN
jgi:hypothetical protein